MRRRPACALPRDLQVLADDACAGIVVGEKAYDWEPTITAVFNFLIRHPDAPVVAPNPDVCFPLKGGRLHPASGATVGFVQFLCQSRGFDIAPIFLGKPYAPIFHHAHREVERRLGRPVPPSRLLMLGDSISADIRGGRDYGTRTALALTGITAPAMLAAADPHPELVFAAL